MDSREDADGQESRKGTPDQVDAGDTRRRAVAALAHQLRTPMSLVAGPLDLLVASATLDQDAARHAALARSSLGRLRADVDRLVEVAAWPARLDLTDADLDDVVHAAVAAIEPDAQAAEVGVRLDLPESPTSVQLHRRATDWALEILFATHTEHAGAGDVVVVSATSHDAHHALALSIACPHAHEHETSTEMAQLATVACELLELEGLSVTIDERVTRDCPAGEVADAEAKPPSTTYADTTLPTAEAGGAMTVLVVEDDDRLREFLQLELAGEHDVIEAGSADAALAAARQVRPDLIVCDIMLPGRDGEQLVHELHQVEGLLDVPILVLTGRTDEALRVRLLQDGADDYLTKPFALGELRARMANLAATRLDTADLRRKAEEAKVLADQLQHALDSRVVIEQAKAVVAMQRNVGLEDAFKQLRSFARSRQMNLHDVARAVVDGSLEP